MPVYSYVLLPVSRNFWDLQKGFVNVKSDFLTFLKKL